MSAHTLIMCSIVDEGLSEAGSPECPVCPAPGQHFNVREPPPGNIGLLPPAARVRIERLLHKQAQGGDGNLRCAHRTQPACLASRACTCCAGKRVYASG